MNARHSRVGVKRVAGILSVMAITAAAFLATPRFGAAQQAGVDWPTFHGNATRGGSSTNAGPTANTATNFWMLAGGKAVESSPAVAATGLAYVGADDGNVYALDPSKPTGPAWTFKTGGPVVSSPTLSHDDKTLYVGSNDNHVYAVDTGTAKQIWSTDVAGPVRASPLLSADGSIIFVVNANGDLFALKTSDGTSVWPKSFYAGSTVTGSLTLSIDGSTLYVATTNGYMYAIPTSGSTANITAFYLDGGAISSPSVDGNGNIYVTTRNGSIESFAPAQAAPRWTYTVPNHVPAVTTPAIGNGIVVFGDNDGALYDLSTASGQPVWNAFPRTGGSIRSSPAISSNGYVYFGSDDGNIYAISASTGIVVWQKNIGVPITSSPAVGPNGTMWIGSDDGVVYRFGQITIPAQPSPGAPTSTPVATGTAGPSPTPSGTTTGAPVITLKPTVKDGQKQTISVTTTAGAVVRFRVNYPNGDHQSHRQTANASGKAVYSFTQGSSKTKHNSFNATVIVKVGSGATQQQSTAQYRIAFGKIDASVEPRTQSAGHIVNIYVHSAVGKRVAAYLLFPNGKLVALSGRTGPHGFMHKRYKVPSRSTKGSNHRVKVIGKTVGGHPTYSTQTYFTVK